jgi:preprotein translocase subunit SecE
MASAQKGNAAGMVAAFDRITGKVRGFIRDTLAELGRCTWPGRQELMESTVLVIVAVVILGCFVAGVDEITRIIIRFITTGRF